MPDRGMPIGPDELVALEALTDEVWRRLEWIGPDQMTWNDLNAALCESLRLHPVPGEQRPSIGAEGQG